MSINPIPLAIRSKHLYKQGLTVKKLLYTLACKQLSVCVLIGVLSNYRDMPVLKYLCLLPLLFLSMAHAEPLTLEELEFQQNIDEGLSIIEEMRLLVDAATRKKRESCIRSFGHADFCSCLSIKLAVTVNFDQYILGTTSTKEEYGYDKLDDDMKAAVDTIRPAREQCVAKVGF